MKHLKMLGFAVMAAAALMAFAGSASATTVTSPANSEFTGTVEATGTGSLLLKAGFANITCTASTVAGKIETNGDSGIDASGKLSTLSFSSCGSSTVDTLAKGNLQIEGTGGTNGVVKGTGSEVTVSAIGTSCVYGTSTGTTLGTFTGGTPATMDISASLPKISGGFACANPAAWSGTYTVTTPATMTVDP